MIKSQNAVIVGLEQMHTLAAAHTRPDELINKLAVAASSNKHNRVAPATWTPESRVLILSDEQLDIIAAAYPQKKASEVFDQAVEQVAVERLVTSPRYPMSPIRAALTRRAVSLAIIGQCEVAAALLVSHPEARVRMQHNTNGLSTYVFVGNSDLGIFDAGIVDCLLGLNLITYAAGIGAIYTANSSFTGKVSPEAQTAFKAVLDHGTRAVVIHNDQGAVLQYPGSTSLDTKTMRVPAPIVFNAAIVDELWRAGALQIMSNSKQIFMAALATAATAG